MKAASVIVLAMAGGIVAGLALSEIIGIVGKLAFGVEAGVRFLPVYLAVACAVAAAAGYRRASRRSRSR
jgi:hypothetical protein